MIQICDHKLLIFLLLIISVLACETKMILTFTGYEEGKVEIRCDYESGYEEQNKYLCRGECPVNPLKDRDIPVESGSPAKDRRFSLTDDRTTRIFTVTITDLRTEDQGQYWCSVRTGLGKLDVYTEIILEIKPVSVVSRVTGEHLNISCHYNSDLKNKIKFMCKGSDPSLCETSGIKASSETNSNGRFSLRDDESTGVFTVTITDLKLEDSGIYWCGAGETGQKNKIKWISVTDLNIVTSESRSRKPTTTASDHMTKPANEDCESISPVTSSTSSPPPSSSSLPPSSSSSVSTLSPKLQLVNIMASVMVIMMVFGLSLFAYFGLRQKRQGVWMKGVAHFSAENLLTEEDTHTVCHYEEIMCTNTHGYSLGLPVFGEHDASDSLTYSTVIFQTADHSGRTSVRQEINATVSP